MPVTENFMINLAIAAGDIIRKGYLKKHSRIEYKGPVDLVTEIDLQVEELLKDKINKAFPQDVILAEETASQYHQSDRMWIIDPLDGTTNYAHRFPFCSVSIALYQNQLPLFAVVYNPILEEMFTAGKGEGAFLNNQPISVSKITQLRHALIGTGFPYDRWQNSAFYLTEFEAILKKAQGIRRAGAASIDLCYLACGRLDGFFEHKLKPWDTAAGSLIINEAGGFITDYLGNEWSVFSQNIIASNQILHPELLKILQTCRI